MKHYCTSYLDEERTLLVAILFVKMHMIKADITTKSICLRELKTVLNRYNWQYNIHNIKCAVCGTCSFGWGSPVGYVWGSLHKGCYNPAQSKQALVDVASLPRPLVHCSRATDVFTSCKINLQLVHMHKVYCHTGSWRLASTTFHLTILYGIHVHISSPLLILLPLIFIRALFEL